MQYQPTTKQIPEYTVFFKQGTIATYPDVGPFVLQAGEEMAKSNPDIKCIHPDYCFVSYLDGEHRETNIKIEYAQAVDRAGKQTDTIKFKTLKPTKVISILHKGPWQNLGEAYAFIVNHLKQTNQKPTGNFREVYIDGPWNKNQESDYLTEIQVPIK